MSIKQCTSTGIAAITLCAATQALAQQENTLGLEEIVVTAQKRSQYLQDVPIAITAFDAKQIELQRINELQDYILKTPNLGFQESGNRSRAQLGIRGVTNLGGDVNVVGIYVDEFNVAPSSSSRTFDLNLFDIERIEVLRGPQGTLFGRNTLGGALNITTKLPSTEAIGGQLTAEIGSYGHAMGRGSINLPLSDKAAIRLTGYYEEEDGFIDNNGPSGRGNDREDYGVRAGIYANPSPNWTLDGSVSVVNYQQGANNTAPNGRFLNLQLSGYVDNINALAAAVPALGIDTLPLNEVGFTPDNRDKIATDFEPSSENDTTIVTLKNEIMLGDNTLTLITGYIDSSYEEVFDGDQSSRAFIESTLGSELSSISQEARLSGPFSDDGFFTVGILVSTDERENESIQLIGDDGMYFPLFAAEGIVEGVFSSSRGKFETDTYAAFGQIEWNISDSTTLALGGRYTRDEITNTSTTAGQGLGIPVPVEADDTFSDFSPSLTITYLPSESLTSYASFKRAYKPGGVRASTSGPQAFDEEIAWNYEIGLKSSLFDKRVTANAAFFYIDWQDLQVNARDALSISTQILNAADATNFGFEIEISALVSSAFRLDLGLGYLDSEFDSFENAVDESGIDFDASGNTPPFAPEYSASIAGQYDFDIGPQISGYVRAEYVYKDDQFGDVENTMPNTRVFNGASGDYFVTDRFIPSYDLVNIRAGLDYEQFSFSLSVENATDEDYITGGRASSISLGGNLDAVGTPRTVIGRFSFNY